MDKVPSQLRSAENRGQHTIRTVLSRALIVLAAIFVMVAVRHHVIPVIIETSVEIIPPPKEVDYFERMKMSDEERYKLDNPDPIKEKRIVTKSLPEQAIVFDVTIGGVEYLGSGEIRRTYTEGSAVPTTCPT